MTDIVERLRDLSLGPSWEMERIGNEAADEIARLRTQNAELEKHCQLMAMEDAGYAVIKRLTDENAGLRAQNAGLLANLKRMLLEFDFLVERGVIPDVRNDIIFADARARRAKAGENNDP